MGFVVPTAFLTSDPFGVGQMSGFDYNQFLKEFDKSPPSGWSKEIVYVNEQLYLMKKSSIESLKIGTTRRKDERIECLKKQGWELIDLIHTKKFPAVRLEKIALLTAQMMGAKMGPESYSKKFDGWTECWPIKTYNVNNIEDIFKDFSVILEGFLSTSLFRSVERMTGS